MRARHSLVALLVLLTGCALFSPGDATTEYAIDVSAPYIKAEAELGANFLTEPQRSEAMALIDSFFSRVAARDNLGTITDWPAVRAHAEAGIQVMIDQGELGTLGAQSNIERLNNFGLSLMRIFGSES